MGPGMMVAFAVVVLVPAWRICSKAGFSGWIGLVALVPIANILLLYFLAFSQWPIERRRSRASGLHDDP